MNEFKQRDNMILPHRWRDPLAKMPPEKCQRLIVGMLDYSIKGEVPDFSDDWALDSLSVEFRNRIDSDKRRYSANCKNGMKGKEFGKLGGRPKKTPKEPPTNPQESPKKPAGKGIGIGKGKGEFKESILSDAKETASLFSLPKDKETLVESSLIPGTDFTKWTAEQFTRSVDAAMEEHPKYKPYRDDFTSYWLEPDKKGRYKFALQKTWETSRRLATWAKNNERGGGRGQGRSGNFADDDYNERLNADLERMKEERA